MKKTREELMKIEELARENALRVVLKRHKEGNVKSSPEVWAAVKTLAEFIAISRKNEKDVSRETVPSYVLYAVAELTDFVDTNSRDKDDGLVALPSVLDTSSIPFNT